MAKKKASTKQQITTRTTSAPMIVRAPARDAAVPAPAVVTPPMPTAKAAPDATIDRDVIARLAFAKFVARGYVHGHALEDWLTAEAELRASLNTRSATA